MKHKYLKYILITVLTVLTLALFLVAMEYYEDKKIYHSLDNVFKEMNYAEVHSGVLRGLPDLSTALNSSRSFREPDSLTVLPIAVNDMGEDGISIFVGVEKTFVVEYKRILQDNTYLYIAYEYRNNTLVQSIEISNSDSSLVWLRAGYIIDKERGSAENWEEYQKGAYWFSSTKGLPSLQLTDSKEVLEYLKPYGIDANWIREKSDYMLYDVVLKRWFEKGSQRYSFDNIGNIKMNRLDIFK